MKATRQQQKMFFALCKQGNWNKEKAEDHAKKLYNLTSFSEITSAQLSPLLDTMQRQIKIKQDNSKERISISNTIHARIYDRHMGKMLYSRLVKVGHEEGLILYFPVSYEVNRIVKDEEEIDVMLSTGKYDTTGKEIYRYDILKSGGQKWLVDMDDKTLQWIATDMETNKNQPLYLLQGTKIIGSVYSEVN